MHINRLFSFFLLALILTTSVSQPILAQSSSSKFKKSTSLFRRDIYGISIFNTPSVSESDFTIRLYSPGEVSGCTEMSKSSVKQQEVLDKIKVEARDSQLRQARNQVRYSNYDCDITHNRSYFDVHLNRDELIQNDIKKLALTSTRYGEFATSDIEVNEKKIDLITRVEDNEFLTTFWFYPKNTVILSAPQAKNGLDIKKNLKAFARTLGFTPIEDYFNQAGYDQKFELPFDALNYAVFIDPQGVFVDKVSSPQERLKTGTIELVHDYYTSKGKTQKPYTLDVYLSIPGSPYL